LKNEKKIEDAGMELILVQSARARWWFQKALAKRGSCCHRRQRRGIWGAASDKRREQTGCSDHFFVDSPGRVEEKEGRGREAGGTGEEKHG